MSTEIGKGLLFQLGVNAVILYVVFLIYVRGEDLVSDYNMNAFFFNYSYGFMKRGFVGSIFHLLGITPTKTLILLLWLLLINLFAFLFYRHAARRIGSGLDHFLLFALLSPATFVQFMGEIGRFDGINVLLLLFSLLLLEGGFRGFVPLLAVVGILVHEGFFLIQLPVLLSVSLWKGYRRFAALTFLLSLVAFLIVMSFGRLDAQAFQSFREILLEEGYLVEGALWAVRHDLGSAWEMVLREFKGVLRESPLLFLSTYAFALAITLGYVYVYLKSALRRSLILSLSPLTVLLLLPITIDHMRWFSLLILNTFILYPYVRNGFDPAENTYLKTTLMLSTLLGPMGAFNAFPFVFGFM